MRFSLSFIALVAPLLVSAAPARHYGKRAAADVLVFKFADVLEQLESGFYQAALAKFKEADFTTAGFASPSVPIEQMKVMGFDEATHSTALQAALKSFGEQPITGCKFNFEPVLTDLATTLATARVVENVGVGAYLGGATLITDPILLDAAGSILSIEARHSSVLNILSAGGAIPSAFDVPLTPSEVLALAGGFIDPSAPCDVGIPANPPLKITNTGAAAVGTKMTFESPAMNGTVPDDKLFCNMILGGAPISVSMPLSECVVPEATNGPVYIWVTSDAQPLVNNAINRSTAQLIAGPALVFVDSVPEAIGTSLRSGGAAAPPSGGGGDAGAAPTAAAGATDKANQVTGPTTDNAITIKGFTNLPAGAR
jgi:hypothetical protein